MDTHITLFHLMFGEQAEIARSNASPRMQRWADLFDGWLEEHATGRGRLWRSTKIWGEFTTLTRKPPWEAGERDVYAYIDWMQQKKRSNVWMASCLSELASFYEFAARNATDGESVPNPLAGVHRPQATRDEPPNCMDMEQTQALLEAMQADGTPPGKRDFAMAMTQLTSALRPKELRHLRWGDLHFRHENKTAWVELHRRPGKVTVELQTEAAEAIMDYLEATGRLASIAEDDYVFPPLHKAMIFSALDKAEAWNSSHPISTRAVLNRVQYHAGRAGLQPESLNWVTLRNTAILLRVDAGDSDEQITHFFGFKCQPHTRALIKTLQATPRKPQWKRGGALALEKHGMYAGKWSRDDLTLVEQAAPQGVKDEVTALRLVMLRTLERVLDSEDTQETLRLLDSFSSATQRLAQALKVQRELEGVDDLGGRLLDITRAILRDKGWEDDEPG